MAGEPVPVDDLPNNLVHADDLPGGPTTPAVPQAPKFMGMEGMPSPLKNGLPIPFSVHGGIAVIDALEKGADYIGGKVTDWSAPHVPPKVAGGLGAAVNAVIQTLPGLPLGEMAKGAASLFRSGAETMMQKAVRPTWESLRSGKAQSAIRTMLDEGYSPNMSSVDAMRTRIADLKSAENAAISGSNATVDMWPVLGPARREMNRISIPNSQTDIAAANRVRDEFVQNPRIPASGQIPVQDAQVLKEANYARLGDAGYGAGLKPAAERDMIKAITRGLRSGIEQAVPDVVPINALQSSLINARKIAERRAMMSQNQNPLSLGVSIAAAEKNPAAVAGLWVNSSDAAKAIIAHMLNTGREQIPAMATRVGMIGVQADSAREQAKREALIRSLKQNSQEQQ